MSPIVAYIIGVVLAIAATVVACVMIVPEKKGKELTGFWKWLHNLFNFKKLLLEQILRVLYIFCTFACILIGFFMLFSVNNSFFGLGTSMAGTGLALIILGPIITRILFEVMMLFILLVKNTMSINSKIKNQNEEKANNEEIFENTSYINKFSEKVENSEILSNIGIKKSDTAQGSEASAEDAKPADTEKKED